MIGSFFLLLLVTWGILETAGSDYYNYKGYVVDIVEENGDTVLITLAGDTESRFTLKWYSRKTYKKDSHEIAIGDCVRLSTTRYSATNIKKISVDYGYSTEGKLVYFEELPERPFLLATDSTTKAKYLVSIISGDDSWFESLETGELLRIWHAYPITAQLITVQSDAQAHLSNGENNGLTDAEIAFIELKGYTVKE